MLLRLEGIVLGAKALGKCLAVLVFPLITACTDLPWADAFPSESGTYTITAFLDGDGNRLTPEQTAANEGDKIIVKTELVSNVYSLDQFQIITDNGEAVEFNFDFAPYYLTFIMPSDNVKLYFEVPPEFPPLPNPPPVGAVAAFLVNAEDEEPYQFYGTLQDAVNAATSGTIEKPDYIFPLCDMPLEQTITLNGGRHIALYTQATQSQHRILRSGSFTGSLFKVENGASLQLGAAAVDALVIDGGAVWSGGAAIPPDPANGAANDISGGGLSADASLIKVEGTLTLKNGAVLQNNETTGTVGGGVLVSGTAAVFTMVGGTIKNNSVNPSNASGDGGGVYVESGAQFTMKSGTINGNNGKLAGGGVYVKDSSVFTLNGGSIINNASNLRDGGGVYLYIGAKFFMTGGSIKGNFAPDQGGGISIADSTAQISGGSIRSNHAGMSGGTGNGGGIRLYSGTLNITGGVISGNTVGNGSENNGGGVYMAGGTFNMQDNALIDQNNDVYLKSGMSITIAEALNPQGGLSAKITPPYYPAPTPTPIVLSDHSSYTYTQADIDKFSVTPNNVYEYGINGFDTVTVTRGAIGKKVVSLAVNAKTNYYENIAAAVGDVDASTSPTNPAVITVLQNTELDSTVSVAANKHISLTVPAGKNYSVKRSSPSTVSLFEVENGGSLQLGAAAAYALVIDGGAIWSGGTATPPDPAHGATNSGITTNESLIYVNGGTLTLNEGAVLQNNAGSTAVYVDSVGQFTMLGGEIRWNNSKWVGGGVRVQDTGSVFIMSGGSINGNAETLNDGGGVAMENGGMFVMTGGTISNNFAIGQGGGISINSATVEISGGSIRGNHADGGYGGGIRLDKGTLTISGGEVAGNSSPNKGSGVWTGNDSQIVFNMQGDALVAQDNDVYLESDKKITITGALTQNPAADIKLPSYTTRQVLDGDTAENHDKFTVDGIYSRIDSTGVYNVYN